MDTADTDYFSNEEAEKKPIQFYELGIGKEVLEAISELGWIEPTSVQQEAIPLILDGKDVLIQTGTGSGKTGAFAIPLIRKILSNKETQQHEQTTCLVLAPSKELCKQIYDVFASLTTKCSREVKYLDISPQVELTVQKLLLAENPDIVIATPERALQHLMAKNLEVKKGLKTLIVDEADSVFSSYEDEFTTLLTYLPTAYQAVLASATLSAAVLSFKNFGDEANHILYDNTVTRGDQRRLSFECGWVKIGESSITRVWPVSVEEINSKQHVGDAMASPTFKMENVDYHVLLYPRGLDKATEKYVYVQLCSYGNSDVPIGFSIRLFGLQEQFIAEVSLTNWEISKDGMIDALLISRKMFEEKLNAQTGELKIRLEIFTQDRYYEEVEEKPVSIDELHEKNKMMYNDSSMSDISFVIEGKTFFAHKIVLLTEKYFSDFTKSFSNESVEIKDIEFDIFQGIMQYVYYREVVDLSKNVIKYFEASKRFEINELSSKCVQIMCDNINMNNVLDIFITSHKHEIDILKSQVLEYVLKNKNFFLRKIDVFERDRAFMSKLVEGLIAM